MTFAGATPAIAAASVGMAERAHAAATFCGGSPAASPSTPIKVLPVAVTSKDFQESTGSRHRHGREAVVGEPWASTSCTARLCCSRVE